MEILVERKWKKDNYTIGNLYINGKWFSNTLEDKDRGLKDSMSLTEIKTLKKPRITAIPTGTYEITLNIRVYFVFGFINSFLTVYLANVSPEVPTSYCVEPLETILTKL